MRLIFILVVIMVLMAMVSALNAQGSMALTFKDVSNGKVLNPESDTLLSVGGQNREYALQINIANDTALGAFTIGLKVYSPNNDKLKINWLRQKDGLGPKGKGDGKALTTIPDDSRMQPLKENWDFANGNILIKEQDTSGDLPDSLLYGSFAIKSRGLRSGPMAPMIELHFSLEGLRPGETAYLCSDTAFIPPGGTLLFASQPPGLSWEPEFSGKICIPVIGVK